MRSVREVLPKAVTRGVGDSTYWFVIGGQAVRCFAPYRPSRDADFGVVNAKDLKSLVALLKRRGNLELLETGNDTVHMNFEGVDVSVFVLPNLAKYVQDQVLNATGILATKAHAILDRGTRRDFFDLYVMLQCQGLGLISCLHALSAVHGIDVNQSLMLRALSYFDDADAEAALPGEGPRDWERIKAFFSKAVAALVVPPIAPLAIQANVVDVQSAPTRAPRKQQPKPGEQRAGKGTRKAQLVKQARFKKSRK